MSTIAIRVFSESSSRMPSKTFKVDSVTKGLKILNELVAANVLADLTDVGVYKSIAKNFDFQPIVQNFINKKTGQIPLEFGTTYVQNL